jgi:hypothetical protein
MTSISSLTSKISTSSTYRTSPAKDGKDTVAAVAEKLGLSSDDLKSQTKDGKGLNESRGHCCIERSNVSGFRKSSGDSSTRVGSLGRCDSPRGRIARICTRGRTGVSGSRRKLCGQRSW